MRCDELLFEMDAIEALGALVGALPAGRMYRLEPLNTRLHTAQNSADASIAKKFSNVVRKVDNRNLPYP